MRSSFIRSHQIRAAAVIAVVSAITMGCGGSDATEGSVVTVLHPPVPTPTVIAQAPGSSAVGDVRLWNFDGETSEGEAVTMNWIMTTTAIDEPAEGLESRFATGVFTFADGSQLILEGVAAYPTAGSVLEVSSSTVRAVVGGTGTYAGARGSVESIHLDDDTWQHIFTLE